MPTHGALVGTDTESFTQSFDNKNKGTGKTLTPSGAVNDGNGGQNYQVTFVGVTTGTITARPLTVTAVADSKGYDGTTSSAGVPTYGALVGTDTATVAQRFDNKNAGTNKTLTPAGVVNDVRPCGCYPSWPSRSHCGPRSLPRSSDKCNTAS